MHEFSLTADALLASFAKPRCCGGEIYRCSKGRLTDGARQLRLDACRTGSARDSAASMVSMSTRGNHPIVACAGRFGCMGASPLRLSFYQPYPHRPPNRAGPKRKRIPYLVERCIGPAATRGSRVHSRTSAHESRPAQSAERDPALSQNPADNRIDLACPI